MKVIAIEEAGEVLHRFPVRETTEIRVERIGLQARVGLWRRSAASTDERDWVLAAGFLVPADGVRELRAALALVLTQLEEEAPAQ